MEHKKFNKSCSYKIRRMSVSYETIRQWCKTSGPQFARRIKKRQGPRGDRWFLYEAVVNIQGKRRYLWRAVDQDGDLIDILVQKRKNTQAARRFFRKLLRSQTEVPIEKTTDKLRNYAAAKRDVMSSVPHCHDQYAYNRIEVSMNPPGNKNHRCEAFARTDTRNGF